MPDNKEKNLKNKFWEQAHQKGIHKNWTLIEEKKPFLNNVIRNIKQKDANILDIGCSIGNYSLMLAEKGFNILGIDVSKTAIALAKQQAKKKNLPNLKFKISDILLFKYKPKSFDLIVDFSCFTHCQKRDWNRYLKKIKKFSKDNSKILLSVWSKNSTMAYGCNPDNLKRNFCVKRMPYGNLYNHFFTKKEITGFFGQNFKIISIDEKKLNSFKKLEPKSNLKLFFVLLERKVLHN